MLTLKYLKDKSTISPIRVLLNTIEHYGKPKSIKSDNEMVFTSKLMSVTLKLLGIKQQTTQLASPWQNGKIERAFGTMKQSFKALTFLNPQSLEDALQEFRLFYNHIRIHQHLDYNSPANVWDNKPIATSKTHTKLVYFKGLGGNVAGYYFLE